MSEQSPPAFTSQHSEAHGSPVAGFNFLDSIELPVLAVDRECDLVNFNQAATALLSLTSSDLGRGLGSIPMLTAVKNLDDLCQHVIAGGSSLRLDVRDGSGSWFSLSIGPLKPSNQNIEGAVLTLTNVTAHRLSLEQAINEREYTKAIINAVSDPLVVVDEDFRIQAANQAFYTMFQVSRESMGEVRLYELGKPDWEVPRLRTLVDAADPDPDGYRDVECDHEFQAAGVRTLRLKARPLPQVGHPPRRMTVLSIQDVTDRKRAEVAAGRLAAVVETSNDAIISKDLDGVISSWNAGAERIFGYTAAEAVGKSIRLIIPRDRYHEEDEVLARIRRGERVEHFDTVRRRKDGTEINISLTVSPVKDADGRIIGSSKIARDVTDRKLAEEAFNRSMTIKDHFLGLVSHELRTPISTVLGNALILQRHGERLTPDEKQQALDDVVTQSRKLGKTIDNLLLLTRLGAQSELQLQPVQLAQVASRVVEAFRGRYPAREIRLDSDENPVVLGAPEYLDEVLENLLSNAVKYSPADTAIEVVVSRIEAKEVMVRVLDRGIGIPVDQIDKLFTPFYRSDAARQTTDGLGLGLALTKRIVEAQGGRAHAGARPGGGSEFGFSLRAFEENARA